MSTLADPATSPLPGLDLTGRVLVAVGPRWRRELAALIPQAQLHVGEVHFAASTAGPGLGVGSVDVLVVGTEPDRREAVRPALRRGGLLLVVDHAGVVHLDDGALRPVGRLSTRRRATRTPSAHHEVLR